MRFDPTQSSEPTLDDTITFGKFKGATWRQLFDHEEGPSYIKWVLESCELVSEELSDLLFEEYDSRWGWDTPHADSVWEM